MGKELSAQLTRDRSFPDYNFTRGRRNFAAAIHAEEELLASGADGIHGVRLANAIHLSSFTGKEVSITEFNDDDYLAQLNQKIREERKFAERN